MKPIQLFSRSALFLTLMIISAYIQITLPTPYYPMHITLQLFVCIVCGFCLPVHYAILSMGVYILMGLIGFPVFASGGGISYIMRPTFGFILGFFCCSISCSALKQRKRPTCLLDYFKIGFVGLFLYYLIGNLYYYFSFPVLMGTHIPLWFSLFNGVLVSIVPDFLLMAIACRTSKSLQIFFQ